MKQWNITADNVVLAGPFKREWVAKIHRRLFWNASKTKVTEDGNSPYWKEKLEKFCNENGVVSYGSASSPGKMTHKENFHLVSGLSGTLDFRLERLKEMELEPPSEEDWAQIPSSNTFNGGK